MPKQEFDFIDYMAPIIVAFIFGVCLFFISLILNWFCINKHDDITKFETLGAKFNVRLGPHSMHSIRRGNVYGKRVF